MDLLTALQRGFARGLLAVAAAIALAPGAGAPLAADPDAAGAIGSFAIDHRMAAIESADTPISLAALNDHVAGSRGPLRNVGGKLFAGRDRIRLYGIVMYGGATFPAKPDAVKIAARLRKEGFNAVRLFAWDRSLAVPDTWSVTYRAQGMLNADGSLNAIALDHFDHFVHQLQQQGLYVMLPLHSGRRYRAAPDCIDACEGLSRLLPALVDEYKVFARELLDHVNPYTGKAYRNDPGVFAVEIGNEDSVVHRSANGTIDRYVTDPALRATLGAAIEQRWRGWLAARYGEPSKAAAAWGEAVADWGAIGVPTRAERASMPARRLRDWIEFASEVDAAYLAGIRRWLKDTVGVTSLVLGGQAHYLMMHSRAASDLADFHSYFGDNGVPTGDRNPANGHPVIKVQNRSVLSWPEPKDSGLFGISEYKDPAKPNLISEYASRIGNQHLAEAEPLVSAYAGFQDLDGIFLTDAHQMNLYSTPNHFTGWYNASVNAVSRVVAALSFRRGDVMPGAPAVLKKTKASVLDAAVAARHWNPVNFHFGGNVRAPLSANLYQQVVDTVAEEQIVRGGGPVGGVYTTTTGQIRWKPLDRIVVDTPMTKTAIGFFDRTELKLGPGIEVRVGRTMNRYAVVQLTSLVRGAALPSSSMLLALSGHFTVPGEVPRAPGQPTFAQGNAPPRIEAVPATVTITTPRDLVVWALDPSGARRTEVAVVRRGDALQFVTGPAFDTGWYLIEER